MTDPRTPRPVALIILDGYGHNESPTDNAVLAARTPVMDRLWQEQPHSLIHTDGRYVGLPDGQMGNSEVGHMNIGAGRVVLQDLPRIDRAIDDGSLTRAPAFADFVERLRASGGTGHVMGLLSPGGVHSHQRHMAALANALLAAGVPVEVHAFTDGRDTPPRAAPGYIREFRRAAPEASIATVSGRYYAMDRDRRWDRTARAYAALVEAEGERAPDPVAAVERSHAHDVTDEFVAPTVIEGYRGMADGDGVLMANFRADRVRQILYALLDPDFDGFARPRRVDFAAAAGMVEYSDELNGLLSALVPPQQPADTLGEVVAAAGLTQLRIAETEKYAHVTFFFNGGREAPFPGEERVLIPSPQEVATYDQKPEMSATAVTDEVVRRVEEKKYDLIVVNYANPDMVGHTGSIEAAVAACEAVDRGLGAALDALAETEGAMIVTADHGNCETMIDPETGGPHTAHTTNPVPVILVGHGGAALRDGRLADLAPTLLALMGLEQPPEMTGRSLLREEG